MLQRPTRSLLYALLLVGFALFGTMGGCWLLGGCTTNRMMRRTFQKYYVQPPRKLDRDVEDARRRVNQLPGHEGDYPGKGRH